MSWLILVLYLTRPVEDLHFIVLKSGRQIPIQGPFRVLNEQIHFQVDEKTVYQLPVWKIDFWRTLHPPVPKVEAKVVMRGKNRIPWEHPMFRNKTRSRKRVSLTTEGLAEYCARKPRPRITHFKGKESKPVAEVKPTSAESPKKHVEKKKRFIFKR